MRWYLSAFQHLGPAWLWRRLWFKVERAAGLLERRSPVRPWSAVSVPQGYAETWRRAAPRLPIAKIDRSYLAPHLEAWSLANGHSSVAEAELISRGRFRVFNHDLVDVGVRPHWQASVLGEGVMPSDVHWARLRDDGSSDVKGVWELSRFAWVYPLVRAWVLDGEAKHVERFWTLLEDWMEANPPNQGPQWMCGQEACLRLIAVAFGLQAFRGHPATTDARVLAAARLATITAERVQAHLGYAVSQRNNHGISEAVGLYTAGALWPQLENSASWRARGLETLFPQLDDLVDRDGGFTQHSTNYHRLFLQLLTWGEVVLQAEGERLPPQAREQASRATAFLGALLEPDGTVPRYGADDSADLFPLSGLPAGDFRPAVGAAQALFLGSRLPAGPWDETALLLLGPMPVTVHALGPPSSLDCREAGVGLLRNYRGTAFFRAPTTWRSRPSQADHQHVSLYWDGAWVTEDLGTYSYRGTGAEDFGSALHHNTVTVERRGPMRKAGRFLWLPWTRCRRANEPLGLASSVTDLGGAVWTRRVLRLPQGFVVIDCLTDVPAGALCELRWHGRSREALARLTCVCSEPSEESWISADTQTGEGFIAQGYGRRQSAWTRRLSARGRTVTFVTAIGCSLRLHPAAVEVDGVRYPL